MRNYKYKKEPKAKFSKALLRSFGKTNVDFKLIEEGDRVLVGLSGGKDSLSLVHLLKNMQRNAPFSFDFKAITVNYGMPDEDYHNLSEHCKTYKFPIQFLKQKFMKYLKILLEKIVHLVATFQE